jgi:RNA polymerase sigma-70 factor (ECF subfamily)
MPDDHSPVDDFDLIRRVTEGDVDAFQPLVKAYQTFVFTIVSRHVPADRVEEIAQETFIRAYSSLPTFKFKTKFRHWLSAIAVRSCYDYWRNAYRNREVPMSALTDAEQTWVERTSSNQTGDVPFARQEARELLQWALGNLSPEDRMVVELVHLEGYSAKEAGDLLGWSTANVKVRAFRSRKKLRTMLEGIME